MQDDTAQAALVVVRLAGDVVSLRHRLRGGRGREEGVVFLIQGLRLLDHRLLHRVGGEAEVSVTKGIGQGEETSQEGIGSVQNPDLIPERPI